MKKMGVSQFSTIHIPLHEREFNTLNLGHTYIPHATARRSRITRVALYRITELGNRSLAYKESVNLTGSEQAFFEFPSKQTVIAKDKKPTFYSENGWVLALTFLYVDFRDKFAIGPIGINSCPSANNAPKKPPYKVACMSL